MKFLLCSILSGLNCIFNYVYEVRAKTFLEGTSLCTQSFLVCAHLTACLRAHMRPP